MAKTENKPLDIVDLLTRIESAEGKVEKNGDGGTVGVLTLNCSTTDAPGSAIHQVRMEVGQFDNIYKGFVKCWPAIKPVKQEMLEAQKLESASAKVAERDRVKAEKKTARAKEVAEAKAKRDKEIADKKAAREAEKLAAKAKREQEAKDKAEAKKKADMAKAQAAANKASDEGKLDKAATPKAPTTAAATPATTGKAPGPVKPKVK